MERYGLRVCLFGVAVVLVGVPFGLLLAQVSTAGRFTELDSHLARWLNERVADHPALVGLLRFVTFLGQPVWLIIVVGLPVVWLLIRRDRVHNRKLVTFLTVTGIGGGLVDTLVKIIVARPRPVVGNPLITVAGKSFPSGHAMGSTICYGALLLAFLPLAAPRWRRWIVGLVVLLVLLIGLSRLALGVHFLSDVLGGLVLGMAWLAASVAAFEAWRIERGRPTTRPLRGGVEPEELGPAP